MAHGRRREMKNSKILVADDDRDIVRSIEIYLSGEGYTVLSAYNGEEALDLATENDIELMILDVMMPKMNGIDTLLRLRERKNIPVIMLSAKSEDSDKIFGLTAGADDYITKPFNPSELIARVKSQLRRYTMLGGSVKRESEIVLGGLKIDKDEAKVTVDGEEKKLTPIEYKILLLLAENAGKVFSGEEIYTRVWNEDVFINDNTIAVHIRHIREKIEINPREPEYLKVVWGIGYKIRKE